MTSWSLSHLAMFPPTIRPSTLSKKLCGGRSSAGLSSQNFGYCSMDLTVLQSMSTFWCSAKAEVAKRASANTKTFMIEPVFCYWKVSMKNFVLYWRVAKTDKRNQSSKEGGIRLAYQRIWQWRGLTCRIKLFVCTNWRHVHVFNVFKGVSFVLSYSEPICRRFSPNARVPRWKFQK